MIGNKLKLIIISGAYAVVIYYTFFQSRFRKDDKHVNDVTLFNIIIASFGKET